MNDVTRTYETRSLDLAASLTCSGQPMIGFTPDADTPRCSYKFEASPSLFDAITSYYDDTMKLPAIALARTIFALRKSVRESRDAMREQGVE